MNKNTSNTGNAADRDDEREATADEVAAAKQTPLQPLEKPDESFLQSIGDAISAPVRDAAEGEERRQTGQPRKG